MKTLNLIGPGRLGQSLARLALESGQYQLGGILARSAEHASAGAAFIGGGHVCAAMAELPAADLWLLAVPDGAIAQVAAELAAAKVVQAGNIVFHASGALEAKILNPVQAQDTLIASLHPAFSFADPARAVATFASTPCAIEGDAVAVECISQFAQAQGGKIAYHAALTMAANYLVTLADLSLTTAAQAGIAPEMANGLVLGLMQQTLNNVAALGTAQALTGPIVRGDAATVAQHLQALPTNQHAAYRALGVATLALAGARLTLPQQAGVLKALQP